ncbi:sensor histidine kinase [Puia dinghuensis]|uniref:histidine kinase n=1 Tax=Puia dinghuensis TaxID=1792502 RepID=A0A8J2UCQ2_9BACT|nr:two-component regulator propeller domain-containing protein [Puia dinghuensis]GGA99733.1 hypothetical protein GCM10011511_23820 [Puia dinghuensis]
MVKALFFCLTLPCAVFAQLSGKDLYPQPHNYIVQQYNSENGLPQNSARDLLLDRNKFLWIATENGLVRFDGQRFRIYNTLNTPVLQMNRFAVLSEDARREVLIRSEFDPSVIFKVRPDYSIAVDSALTRLPHKLISFHSNGIFDEAPLLKALSDTALQNILLQATTYWILNEKEVVIRYGNDWYYLSTSPQKLVRLPVEPEQNEVQYAFFKQDIFGMFRKGGRLVFFKHGEPAPVQLDASMTPIVKGAQAPGAQKIFVYTKGGLTIAKVDNDIYALDIGHDTLKAKLLFKDLQFLEDQPFYSFQYDSSSGRLFIGTQHEGLFVVSPRQFHALTYSGKDFTSNVFMACQTLPGNRLLTSNGIFDMDHRSGDILFPTEERLDRHCLYKAADGSIWLSRHKMLTIYDSTFTHATFVNTFLMDSYITAILHGSDGAIWISTISSLWKWEKGRLSQVIDRYPAFIGHPIETMAESSPGTLWIATWDGIYVCHMATGKLEEKPLFPHVYARCIFQAKDKRIFIGTYGNGYFSYNNGRFMPLPQDSRKYLANVHTILEDDKGYFWMSTNHGLFRVRENDLENFTAGRDDPVLFEYFDKTFGFNTNEFNGGCTPAAVTDRAGNFYFPSLNGVVYFNPDSVSDPSHNATLVIDDLSVDSVPFDHKQNIRIPPDFNRIVADVSIPYYGLEDNLNLEYTIDAAGGKWYPVGRDGRIIINRLPYGKYALSIRDRSNNNNQAAVGITFQVLPHWYDTRLFYVLLVVVLVGVVLLFFWLRTRILRNQNFRLQAKVEERTSELAQSTLLKQKLVSVIIHDLRSPLFSISLLINHLTRYHQEMDVPEIHEQLEQLDDACKGICRFTTDFLTWFNSQKDGFTVRYEEIHLEEFIRETGVLYKDILVRKKIDFYTEIPPGLTMVSDRNILAIIIRNLLDNAVKYTIAGSILVRVEQNMDGILVQVVDTGPGMTADKVQLLLNSEHKNPVDSTSSFGYRFITELVRRLDGHLSIDSAPGQGTVVSVLHPSRA